MNFLCDSKYLIFPASHHAQNKRIFFYINDRLVYDFVMALDYIEPDYEFYINVERFHGKNIRISIEPDMELKLRKSDSGIRPEEAYTGKYRPLAHFTAKRGWLNDPNGLVYYQGKYLMFFQHNPAACTWENMHWGYAVSDDLIHWKEQEIALFPDEDGTLFSGCAVIDRKNLTGLKENENDVLLLFYTAAGGTSETSKGKLFTQSLAYSTDGGRTFRRYKNNPLIENIKGWNRDPKVIYYEPTDSYIMTFYVDEHDFVLYSSKNLLDWTPLDQITLPEDAECPDFYPLAVDDNPDNIKWVFIAAADHYLIGSFDGSGFTAKTGTRQLNYGNASYAAQSWSDIPDGRRIRTSFASAVIPGMPFGSCMSIPQEMSLKTRHGEAVLCANPVRELENLYTKTENIEPFTLTASRSFSKKLSGKCYDLSFKIAPENKSVTRLSVFGLSLEYDSQTGELRCLDKTAPVRPVHGILDLRIIIDTIYAEIFADGGSVFLGMSYIQDRNLNTLKIETVSGQAEIEEFQLAELGAFWEQKQPM